MSNWRTLLVGLLMVATGARADISVWAAPEGYKIDQFGKKIFVLDKAQKLSLIHI